MSKKKEVKVEDAVVAEDKPKEVSDAPKKAFTKAAPKKRVFKANELKVPFSRWARDRGIRTHHLRGMEAFVSNPNTPRTLKEWDKIFESY